jgi:Zn-finger nucleic acid-binding protein
MECPRDGSGLSAERYEGEIELDRCAACRGTWLDTGELEAIQKTVERDHSKHVDAPMQSVKESYNAVQQGIAPRVPCPKCGTSMTVRPFGMGSQIVIDECPDGCGIWLDGGELEALERFYEASQSETVIPLHWRLWAGVVGLIRGIR